MILLSHFASAALLADGRPALLIGEVIGTLLFPAVGVLLLVLGLRERSKARRAQPPSYPGYPPYPPAYPPPGYPPPYPVGYPPPGYPPVPPPRPTAGQGKIIAGSILTVLGLLGAGVNVLTSVNERKAENSTPPVKVGQCITGEAMASGVIGAHGIVACSQPAGVFEVVSTGGRDAPCPDGARDDTDYARWINDTSSVCFVPNLLTGQCYANVKHAVGDRARTDTIKPVACTDTSAEFKVLQRFEKADYDLCPVGSHQRIWTDPPRTYCTGPPA